MALIPLALPNGVYKNGTDLQSAGRWSDANLVRWSDDALQPVGGWRSRSASAANAQIRGLIAWNDNSGVRHIVGGTYNKLWYWHEGVQRYDITPTSFTAGRIDAVNPLGFGQGLYGYYEYGVERRDTGSSPIATTWQLDLWGEYLIGCSPDDGKLYEWTLNSGTPAAVIANAPTSNKGVMVTDERFVLALGSGNPRTVAFSDQEDNTVWASTVTNQAGTIELNTTGSIVCGVRVRGQSLILTTDDAHVMNFIGQPFIYGHEKVGSKCGIASSQAVAVIDAGAIWMGNRGFYTYAGGGVNEIKSEVGDYIFSNMNFGQISKVASVVNSQFSEIIWFYPSTSSIENDRYVAFNYQDQTWSIGAMGRTSGVDRGIYNTPIYANATDFKIYDHEVGFDYSGDTPYAETGAIQIGNGDNIMHVKEVIPDEKNLGDVSVTFKTRPYPTATETSHGAYSTANPTSVRFNGREVRMKVTAVEPSSWRVGIMRIDAVRGGRR